MRSPPVDQAERRYQFTAEKQIFGNREMLHQRKILIDDAHSEGPRGLRVRKLSGSAVYTNFACIRLIEPGHYLDQRTLACPVSAEQRMHLATPHIEIDIFKRYDTWKCLAQSAQLEDHLTCTSGRWVHHSVVIGAHSKRLNSLSWRFRRGLCAGTYTRWRAIHSTRRRRESVKGASYVVGFTMHAQPKRAGRPE